MTYLEALALEASNRLIDAGFKDQIPGILDALEPVLTTADRVAGELADRQVTP